MSTMPAVDLLSCPTCSGSGSIATYGSHDGRTCTACGGFGDAGCDRCPSFADVVVDGEARCNECAEPHATTVQGEAAGA
jgi:RecJ-like exonuclease